MKTKGTNSEVCHMWANQAQDRLSNANGSLYFEDNTIYSYGRHFPIATHVNNDVILFTIHSYSNTTAKHMCDTRQAIDSDKTVFHVNHVIPDMTGEYNHSSNLKNYDDRFKDLLNKASRARSNKPYLLECAIELANQANCYASYFGIAWHIETDNINLDEIKESLNKLKAEKAKKEKARKKQLLIENKQKIIDWKKGANIRLPYDVGFLLRLNKEDKIIETSQGANIPVEAAIKLWPLICRAIKNKTPYNINIKLGYYTLTRIDINGNIKVGCHYIKYPELESMAKKLELMK